MFWGILHGTFLAIHRMMRSKEIPHGLPSRAELWKVVATFNLVCLAWVFFRADGFGNALAVLGRIASLADGPFILDGLILLVFAVVAMTLIDIEQRRTGHHVPHLDKPGVRGSFVGAAGAAIILFAGQPAVPFLYFQF